MADLPAIAREIVDQLFDLYPNLLFDTEGENIFVEIPMCFKIDMERAHKMGAERYAKMIGRGFVRSATNRIKSELAKILADSENVCLKDIPKDRIKDSFSPIMGSQND